MSFTEVHPARFDAPDDRPVATEKGLEEARKAIIGNQPTVPPSPDPSFPLPRGLWAGGKWETQAMVRELTGVDEELLARFKDVADFFDGVIVYGTSRIGAVDLESMPFSERQSLLMTLLTGERDQLFLAIVRATYGDERELSFTCAQCQAITDIIVNLATDFPSPEMEDPHSESYHFTTSKGVGVDYRLTTGAVQREALKRKTAAEQNTVVLSECILRVNGAPPVDPVGEAKRLSIRDRENLLKELVSKNPMPDMEIETECAECGAKVVMGVAWGDLFRT